MGEWDKRKGTKYSDLKRWGEGGKQVVRMGTGRENREWGWGDKL